MEEIDFEASMSDRVKALSQKWITQGFPKPEEFYGLTPNEARAVAYYAGYNTNDEIHFRVRESCARDAGEEVVSIPENRFHSAEVGTVRTFHNGQLRLFETIDGAIIRFRIGVNQAEMRRRNFGTSEQEFVNHILHILKPQPMPQAIDWQGDTIEVWVRNALSMWVLRFKDGNVYQLHPSHSYGFALTKMQELLNTKG